MQSFGISSQRAPIVVFAVNGLLHSKGSLNDANVKHRFQTENALSYVQTYVYLSCVIFNIIILRKINGQAISSMLAPIWFNEDTFKLLASLPRNTSMFTRLLSQAIFHRKFASRSSGSSSIRTVFFVPGEFVRAICTRMEGWDSKKAAAAKHFFPLAPRHTAPLAIWCQKVSQPNYNLFTQWGTVYKTICWKS